jgi:hypothetical protein
VRDLIAEVFIEFLGFRVESGVFSFGKRPEEIVDPLDDWAIF